MTEYMQFSEGRALELLADQAVFGLAGEQQEELDTLLATMPDIDRDCMRTAAATVHLASIGTELEPMPISLKRNIIARARQ